MLAALGVAVAVHVLVELCGVGVERFHTVVDDAAVGLMATTQSTSSSASASRPAPRADSGAARPPQSGRQHARPC